MATIRHPSILKLGEFHTVHLYRNLTQGSLVVDGQPAVNGSSQVGGRRRGQSRGLELRRKTPPFALQRSVAAPCGTSLPPPKEREALVSPLSGKRRQTGRSWLR